MQANSWHHKWFQFPLSFWIRKVWKGRGKITKIWISREWRELRRWNKIIFHSFWRAIIWWKNKKLTWNSGHKFSVLSNFQIKYLVLFLLFSVIDDFEWFWMENFHKNIQLMWEFFKAPFLVLQFSYYILMILR